MHNSHETINTKKSGQKRSQVAIFILVGLVYIEPSRLTTLPPLTARQAIAGTLLLIFMYGGYEVVPVPGGEAIDPRRDAPFALVATILVVTVVMTLTQIVAQGVLPDLAIHSTPIADAAAVFLGASGALPAGSGSVLSMTGNNAGQVLTGARNGVAGLSRTGLRRSSFRADIARAVRMSSPEP